MLTPRTRLVFCVSGVLALTACGDDPPDIGGSPTDSGVIPQEAAAGECTGSASQGCACTGGGSGTQSCVAGLWTSCFCPSTGFDAGPVTMTGECKPGLYSGSFSGSYSSGFAFGFPIPVEALDVIGGSTGLSFVLEKQETNSGGEFSTLAIKNGYVRGTANGAFPFEGVLTGELDCNTKEFKGTLEGCYALGIDLGVNVGRFIGPTPGTYDPNTHTFVGGTWTLDEKMPLFPGLGGKGTWNASYKGPAPADMKPQGAPNCMVMAGGGGSDAGTPAPDAGP